MELRYHNKTICGKDRVYQQLIPVVSKKLIFPRLNKL